jgi:hypothetical protein
MGATNKDVIKILTTHYIDGRSLNRTAVRSWT